jgi:hypothetical protein
LSFQDRKNRTNCKEFQSRAWQAPTPLGGSLYNGGIKRGYCWIGAVGCGMNLEIPVNP